MKYIVYGKEINIDNALAEKYEQATIIAEAEKQFKGKYMSDAVFLRYKSSILETDINYYCDSISDSSIIPAEISVDELAIKTMGRKCQTYERFCEASKEAGIWLKNHNY